MLEEESSLLSKAFVKPKDYKWINDEVLVVVVKVNKTEFSKSFSNIEVCGKTILQWVMMTSYGKESVVFEDEGEQALLNNLKNINTSKKYIFLQYSDTPYLEKNTFNRILDYFSTMRFNVMGLPRGFVVKTDYLKNLSDLNFSTKKEFEGRDFVQIKSSQDLTDFYNFTREKILNYHRQNGVMLLGNNICVDADVEIGFGSVVYENNTLKGQTYIGENVVLRQNNLIIDSIIENECDVTGCYIEKSKVKEKTILGPCAKIIKESVGR